MKPFRTHKYKHYNQYHKSKQYNNTLSILFGTGVISYIVGHFFGLKIANKLINNSNNKPNNN